MRYRKSSLFLGLAAGLLLANHANSRVPAIYKATTILEARCICKSTGFVAGGCYTESCPAHYLPPPDPSWQVRWAGNVDRWVQATGLPDPGLEKHTRKWQEKLASGSLPVSP